MKSNWTTLLISLLVFLGLGAAVSGALLMLSPSGQLLGIPQWILETSPFSNFLFPGMLLFTFIGIAPFLVIIALLKKPNSKIAERFNAFKDMHWSWSFVIYQAIVLIIWIQIQMLLINGVHFLHTFYVFLALSIFFIALLPQVKRQYQV
ncbi:hypothetical protein [Spongiivirga citrea]|uniref:DUF1648 domain-containing protein n=1 Tax=Spongiivirga citrea TaxID=1481457 RepID=A0A6M0CD80_9FLAO|nr:hypothetical protein [Spongiivirga citrea]NER15735.1 hypothetical protein [Spongiivirga citrea]